MTWRGLRTLSLLTACCFLTACGARRAPVVVPRAALPAAAAAPIPVHPSHPQAAQKPFYNSEADWVCDDAQGHASAGPVPATVSPFLIKHGHARLCYPKYGITTGPVVGRLELVQWRVNGRISGVTGPLISKIVWDDTGTEIPPPLIGDPAGERVIVAHITFDPAKSDPQYPTDGTKFVPPNGWWAPRVNVYVSTETKEVFSAHVIGAVYSRRDPAAPQVGFPFLSARNEGIALPGTRASAFGVLDVEIPSSVDWWQFLPIAPIREPWFIYTRIFGYGGMASAIKGRAEFRCGINFHHGVDGKLIYVEESDGGNPNGNWVTLDPIQLGAGAHKCSLFWIQPTGAGNENFAAGQIAAAGLSFTVVVPDGFEPPPPPPPTEICGNGIDDDGDGLVDEGCTPPPPPPPLSWTPGSVWSRPAGTTGVEFQVCPGTDPADARCVAK